MGVWCFVLAAVGGCSCGGDAPECVIDTDCPNAFERCSDRGRCTPFASGEMDAGGDSRDSGMRDAGARDSGAADTGPADGGSVCDTRAGMWSVASVVMACGSTMNGYVLRTQRAMADMCVIEFVSVDTAMLVADGSAPVDDAGMFTSSTLNVGGVMMSCNGTLGDATMTLTCTHSDGSGQMCTLFLTRM